MPVDSIVYEEKREDIVNIEAEDEILSLLFSFALIVLGVVNVRR